MVYNFASENEKLPFIAEDQNWILAALFNLIVVADTLEQALRCQEFVRLITEKFPCRVFLIQTDETSQTDFFHTDHFVQAVGKGTERVCYDVITIESSLKELNKAPFAILPKIISDLPVYVLLGHDPTTDHLLLPELEKFASRIIFDDHSIENLQEFATRMLHTIQTAHNDFIDLNWSKTKAWREVLALVFADPQNQELLGKSKMIHISYCSPPVGSTKAQPELQAIYLQAWLAAQLGWKLLSTQKDEANRRIQYHIHELPLEISLLPTNAEMLETGQIFSIEIMTHNDCHFLISHEGKLDQVTVHASSTERCEMPYSHFMGNYQKGTALVNETLYQPPNEHYVAMLHLLNHPCWSTSP